MRLIYGGVPYNTTKVNHYEVPTNDCDMIASDLQAGKTAVARGKKIIGTGKSFEFAEYGTIYTNFPISTSSLINVIDISSSTYYTKTTLVFRNMKNIDFSTPQVIGDILIDDIIYPITVVADGQSLTLNCEKMVSLEAFFGKDNYI